MKTVIFSSYDSIGNPFYGGGGAYAIDSVARQLRENYTVLIVTSRYPGQYENIRTIHGVTYIYIGSRINNPYVSQILYICSLPYFVLTQKYDVWIESFNPPISTTFVNLFTSRPVIGLVHLLSGNAMTKVYHIPLFKVLESLLLKSYRHLVVLSTTSRKEITHLAPHADIHIIPNGVSSVHSPPHHNRRDWVYLGRIDDAQKGLGLLISAFERAAPKTTWNLIIAGTGKETEVANLTARINASPLKERIRYVGRIQGSAKVNLLSSGGSLVLASHYETFPLVLLEAFVHRCPVVTVDIPDLSWIPSSVVRKAHRSPSSLSAAMVEMADRPGLRQKYVRAAARYARRFEWKNITHSYKQLIDDVMEKNAVHF